MFPAIFLDKDGTLIPDIPYNVDPTKITLSPGADLALRSLHESGYKLIIISNQSGVARGYFSASALRDVEQRIRELLAEFDVPLTGFYYCPHHPTGAIADYAIVCQCRKPEPGLILKAAQEHNIDCQRSWMIGDILNDVEAGRKAGCQTMLIDNGNETEWILTAERTPHHRIKDLTEAAQIITSQKSIPYRLSNIY
jgi:D-glycero-D-manno-heptose 1,7-bisphosphate phosphatase